MTLDRAPPSDQTPAALEAAEKTQTSSAFFTLSWSHYVFLISIENPDERSFYEIEAAAGGWTLAELKRQFDSGLYERLALSRDRDARRDLAREGQIVAEPKDVLKNPYVLEFLGLKERPSYSESDLGSAIIDQLEDFLLELGKGFLFEARQKRFTFDEEHFFVDLVFYNRLLRYCERRRANSRPARRCRLDEALHPPASPPRTLAGQQRNGLRRLGRY